MALRIAAAARNGMVNNFVDNFDATTFTLEIRTGSRSATVDAAASGSVLATFTGPSVPAFGAASDSGTASTATAGAIANVNASATGTAGHFRLLRSGTLYADGTVGLSSADLILNDVDLVSGQPVSISSMTVTLQGG